MAVNIMQSQQCKARLNTLQVSATSNPTKSKLCTVVTHIKSIHKKVIFCDSEGGDCAFAVEEYNHTPEPTFYFKAIYISTWAGPNLHSGQIWCGGCWVYIGNLNQTLIRTLISSLQTLTLVHYSSGQQLCVSHS